MSVWLAGAILLASGCGEHGIAPPSCSPDKAAQEAMAQYDADGDGYLSGKELDGCPALKNSLTAMDKDKDGRLSAAEIADAIRELCKDKVGAMTVRYRVTLDGSPLSGATVTLVPEKFLGPNFKPASGKTDERGVVLPAVEGLPGVAPGFYRIEITAAPGQPELPARYHRETELGEMVGPSSSRAMVELTLSSR